MWSLESMPACEEWSISTEPVGNENINETIRSTMVKYQAGVLSQRAKFCKAVRAFSETCGFDSAY